MRIPYNNLGREVLQRMEEHMGKKQNEIDGFARAVIALYNCARRLYKHEEKVTKKDKQRED